MSTITSANSVFMLGAAGLYNIPMRMQGYSADDAFAVDEVEFMEKYMGVDGRMAVGFTPYIVPLEFTLMANSPSLIVMDTIIGAEKVKREKIELTAVITIPSLSQVFSFTTGYLDKGSLIPSAGKTLKPRKFTLAFQDMASAPI